MERRRLPKRHCQNCILVKRKQSGPQWGLNVQAIDGCSTCLHRYEVAENELVRVKSEHAEKTESHEATLAAVKAKNILALNERKADYESVLLHTKKEQEEQAETHEAALTILKANHELELNEEKAKYESLLVQVKREEEEREKLHEAALATMEAKSEFELAKQKVDLNKELLNLKTSHTLELDQLEREYNIEYGKVKFLQITRENYLPGDVLLGTHDAGVLHEQGGGRLLAHQSILAARSCVFRNVIESGTHVQDGEGETRLAYIQINGASDPVMEAVICFCYTGEITFGEAVPPDEVLKVACEYQIELLMDVCISELCRGISIDNLPYMLKLSRTFRARKLQEEAGKFFKEHFDDLKDRVFESLEETVNTKLP